MTAAKHSVVIKKTFSASRERVFKAFSTAQAISDWFKPQAKISIDILVFEFKPGGQYRFRYVMPSGEKPILGGIYEEIESPNPSLMGQSAIEKARIDMWSERVYAQLFLPYGLVVKHTIALFSDVVEQVPSFAESQRRLIPRNWQWLDHEMSDGRTFIAGDEFSFADIQAMVVLMIADAIEFGIPEQCSYVQDWADKIRRRPSWEA